jgi:hypothetical protein
MILTLFGCLLIRVCGGAGNISDILFDAGLSTRSRRRGSRRSWDSIPILTQYWH